MRTVVVTLANSATGTIGAATQTLTLPSSGSPVLATFVIANAAATAFPVGSTFGMTVTLAAGSGASQPSFTVEFRVRVP